MVSTLFAVEHGACALCHERVPLFVLHLIRGEEPKLEPLAKGTHTGCCLACFVRTAEMILRSASVTTSSGGTN